MAFISWTNDFSVGVDDFDRQHKKLFDMINGLHDAMKQGKASTVVSSLLKGLKDYTVIHFTHEEKEMQRVNCPELAYQKTQHAAFVAKIAEWDKKLADGKSSISLEMMDFLRDWLSNHIKIADKKYAPYFSKVAVK